MLRLPWPLLLCYSLSLSSQYNCPLGFRQTNRASKNCLRCSLDLTNRLYVSLCHGLKGWRLDLSRTRCGAIYFTATLLFGCLVELITILREAFMGSFRMSICFCVTLSTLTQHHHVWSQCLRVWSLASRPCCPCLPTKSLWPPASLPHLLKQNTTPKNGMVKEKGQQLIELHLSSGNEEFESYQWATS